MINKTNLLIALLVLALIVSCKTHKVTNSEKNQHDKKECTDVHWSHHKGVDGPENWKNLCVDFSECNGKSQSPINIVTTNVLDGKKLQALKFNYEKSTVDIVNKIHTVQFNVTGNNIVNINGKDYKLLQFHYHAKSEHTIDGKYYPIEVHFVHRYSDDDFAVLGIMFDEGNENELFNKYLDKFPISEGAFKSDDMIDILSLFPLNKSYYNYKGSLTTPPCSEVVNWYVLKAPLTASKNQIGVFSKILNKNYRPIMPLNRRVLRAYSQ
jgi:carbonic anhydrase